MALPQPKPDGIPAAIDLDDLISLLEGYIGERLTRQTMINWIAEGYFPHARKRSPQSNSKWWITVEDVIAYVQRAYPSGPLTLSVNPGIQPVFNYVVSAAAPVPA